ncbi:family 10 glycosylhydrolase [Fulvivirgaceae bacterium BMA10]|uniref:Family 10 glycosylhydrolase n=1 Tax=Splendidivirga corallicola TaxID=3051826 RepID=A0ABT8KLN3_9BACT|nr:family 10 glycosylhydrolase [Fulvivirgaceae bacterium BMA10]
MAFRLNLDLRIIIFLLIFSNLLFSCSETIYPKREMRAVWIATVKNIDWPSRPGLSSEEQKNEFRKIISFHQLNGINAAIVQIRPAADAFYQSRLEPWSEWLTDQQGKAPDPYYDPLTFMIEECHDKGMEFHAWFNPYRAIVDIESNVTDSLHITNSLSEWFLTYGKNAYFDPGIPEVREYVTNIVADVVTRYDIDAVHFDDYFYPYKIYGEAFPDSASYKRYNPRQLDLDDWRRSNVDEIIVMLNNRIKSIKPHVKFGISPFGVWRNQDKDPNGSATQAGVTNYDDLYADVTKWLKNGWIDYVVPQLYWNIGFEKADYAVLIDWWEKNSYGKHLYIGHGAYKIDDSSNVEAWRDPKQLPSQLRLNKQYEHVKGSAYFSSKVLLNNPLGITDTLRNTFYRHPALIPQMPWIDSESPNPPKHLEVVPEESGVLLKWKPSGKDEHYYLIYRFEGKGKKAQDINNPANILSSVRAPINFYLDETAKKNKQYTYIVTAVDRLHNESKRSEVNSIKNKIRR